MGSSWGHLIGDTFTADNTLTNRSVGSCRPIEIENAGFDIFITKEITMQISIEITDHIPSGL